MADEVLDYIGSVHGTLADGAAFDDGSLLLDGVDDSASFPFFQNPGVSSDWTFLLVFKATALPEGPPDRTILGGFIPSTMGGIFSQTNTSGDGVRWIQHHVTTGDTSQIRIPMCNPSDPLNVGNFSLNTWYALFLRRIGSPSSLRANLIRTGSATSQNHVGVVQQADLVHYAGFNSPLFDSPGDGPHSGFWPGRMAFGAHWSRRISDAEVTTMFEGVKAHLAGRGINL